MTFMERLPTVISCCFCCFLRAGTIVISIFSFLIGLLFVPNINHTPGFWDMNDVLGNFSEAAENAIQLTLGIVSVLLCIASFLLLIGVCLNMIVLIEIYQWCSMIYSITVFLLFFVLAIFCFFVNANSFYAGAVLLVLMVFIVLCTMYFIIVVNSLRMSMKELNEAII